MMFSPQCNPQVVESRKPVVYADERPQGKFLRTIAMSQQPWRRRFGHASISFHFATGPVRNLPSQSSIPTAKLSPLLAVRCRHVAAVTYVRRILASTSQGSDRRRCDRTAILPPLSAGARLTFSRSPCRRDRHEDAAGSNPGDRRRRIDRGGDSLPWRLLAARRSCRP